ncbi:MAG: hypothetical protein SGARI_002718, partial [Bacillariaceae sp.]
MMDGDSDFGMEEGFEDNFVGDDFHLSDLSDLESTAYDENLSMDASMTSGSTQGLSGSPGMGSTSTDQQREDENRGKTGATGTFFQQNA